MLTKGKYKTSFLRRFGFGFPVIKKEGQGPIIWLHAVSLGETVAVSQLAKDLVARMPGCTLVVSSTTETGHSQAKRLMPFAKAHVFFPFDFFLSVAWVFRRCRPDLVLIAESDLWYRFLKQAKKKGAVCVVVNGKLSEKSAKFYNQFRLLSKRLFSLIDGYCVQDETYKRRLSALGIPASKIVVTGNLKSDIKHEPMKQEALIQFRKKFALEVGDFVLVIGSTHAPEEKLLLEQILPLVKTHPQLKVLIAPRHPERFSDVLALIEHFGLPFASWNQGIKSPDAKIVLIDTTGILKQCYQLADVAIVAGSFTDKVGGHNILEAQSYGIPVITGPFMHTQQPLLQCSLAHNALIQVPIDQVQNTLRDLIACPEKRQAFGQRALELVESLSGATCRSMNTIQTLVPQFFE